MTIVREADFLAGGPKGRDEITTSVKGVVRTASKVWKARRADTSNCRVNLLCRAFGALN